MNPFQIDGLSEANGIPEPWAEGQGRGDCSRDQLKAEVAGLLEALLTPHPSAAAHLPQVWLVILYRGPNRGLQA